MPLPSYGGLPGECIQFTMIAFSHTSSMSCIRTVLLYLYGHSLAVNVNSPRHGGMVDFFDWWYHQKFLQSFLTQSSG